MDFVEDHAAPESATKRSCLAHLSAPRIRVHQGRFRNDGQAHVRGIDVDRSYCLLRSR
jgi:hypothetical protein